MLDMEEEDILNQLQSNSNQIQTEDMEPGPLLPLSSIQGNGSRDRF